MFLALDFGLVCGASTDLRRLGNVGGGVSLASCVCQLAGEPRPGNRRFTISTSLVEQALVALLGSGVLERSILPLSRFPGFTPPMLHEPKLRKSLLQRQKDKV